MENSCHSSVSPCLRGELSAQTLKRFAPLRLCVKIKSEEDGMPAKLAAPLKTYYDTLAEVGRLGTANEGAVRIAFQNLLAEWGRPRGLSVLGEQTITGTRKRPIRLDGLLVDALKLHRGIWESK